MDFKEIAVQYLGEYMQSGNISTKKNFNRKQYLFVEAQKYYKTRMHSSRMRTDHGSVHLGSRGGGLVYNPGPPGQKPHR